MKKLGFGLMRLPLLNENDPSSIDKKQVCQMVDDFLEKGFTYFDTAYMYHNFQSEKAVKEVLTSRHPRESFLLASKMPTPYIKKEEDLERIFNEQLENCGVTFFDYYLLHNLGRIHYEIAQRFHIFEFLSKKKKEGKIHHLGFSFHDKAEILDRILNEHPETEFVQLQLNYLDWEDPSVQSGLCHQVALRHGKNIIVMEPVKGGTLAKLPERAEALFQNASKEASVPSYAIRFAAMQENVMVVLSGMSDLNQLHDNMSYMEHFSPLNEKEQILVKEAAKIIRESVAIPCTGCSYCTDGCPMSIPIPKLFHLYNEDLIALNQGFSIQSEYYDNLTAEGGKASTCIGCRQCEEKCPQHIPISKELIKIKRRFE